MDVPAFRRTDPKVIALVRSADEFMKRGGRARKDDTVFALRWAPTSNGLALTIRDCGSCHTGAMPDGSFLNGAPFNEPFNGVIGELVRRGTTVFFPGDSPAVANWREFTVPWIRNDVHDNIKAMSEGEMSALFASVPPGVFPRFNGSPYYPTKVPDHIGIKDRKYIDHTATHRGRRRQTRRTVHAARGNQGCQPEFCLGPRRWGVSGG